MNEYQCFRRGLPLALLSVLRFVTSLAWRLVVTKKQSIKH